MSVPEQTVPTVTGPLDTMFCRFWMRARMGVALKRWWKVAMAMFRKSDLYWSV